MPHFLQVLLTWQCNVRGNWSTTQGHRHVRLFVESLLSSGRIGLSIRPSDPKGLDSAAACSGEIVGSVELRNCKQEKNWEETSFFPPLPPFRPPFSFASSTLSRFPHYLRAWKRLVLNWQKAEKERCILKLVLGDFWRSGCEKSMAIIFFSENTGAHIWEI